MSLVVCVDEDSFVLDGDDLCIIPGLQDLREIVTFTTPGVASFDKATYPWLARVVVCAQGAGGGSGSANPTDPDNVSFGGGGGAGGYAEAVVEASDLSSSETVIVGAGGAAGSLSAGDAGEGSSFGSWVSAEGGQGGRAGGGQSTGDGTAWTSPAQGGIGTVGHILGAGGDGEPGFGRGIIQLRKAGMGGSSYYGGGRGGRASTGVGLAGRIASGEGAGGAAAAASQAAQDGAAGADGRVVVYLYG